MRIGLNRSLVTGIAALVITAWPVHGQAETEPAITSLSSEAAESPPSGTVSAVFVSGTIKKWNPQTKALSLETYLNEKGNPAQELIEVILTAETEILGSDALAESPEVREGQDVDAEFDPATRKATYLYIYS